MATWPKNNKASTQYVDADTDLIGNSRPDIKKTIDNVNDIIDTFDIGGDSASQIADGDILQYQQDSAGGGRFVPLSSDTIGGANKMLIPFTGWVVNNHSGITTGYRADDSAGSKHDFDRMALLGGAYYRRLSTQSGDLDLISAETSYNSIPSASVTTATPTLTKPTGYTASGGNVTVTVTNGIATNTKSTTAQLNAGGSNDVIVDSSTRNVMYGEGYDSYITLPAGSYFLRMIGLYDAEYNVSINHARTSFSQLEQECENFIQVGSPRENDMWIYNKTDDTFITDPRFTLADQGYIVNTFTSLDKITTGSQGQIFTLTGTKQIMIWAGANTSIGTSPFGDPDTPDVSHDFLGFRAGQSTILTGDAVTGDNVNFTFSKQADSAGAGVGIPARFGWVTRVPNTWIEITKL